jgi:hypothetical protein
MRKLSVFAIIFTLVVPSILSAQQKRGPSTPEERARAVEIAQKLEADPLNPTLRDDYKWLLEWGVEVPDISVSICTANMPWKSKYKHSGDLAAVNLASSLAFVIQHPDEAKDASKVGTAAAESICHAYEKIIQRDPKGNSKEMDEMLAAQKSGKLSEYVGTRWQSMCK